MIFTQTEIAGAVVLDLERREDSRGFFARAFCTREFEEHGLNTQVAQANVASSVRKGTVRGMHFQFPPSAEAKLVRCTRGAILDVVVDLRPESTSYLGHIAVELSARNGRALYVPERFAHGYQVLEDDTEIIYQASEFYAPEAQGGLRYDDPALAIQWSLPTTGISEQDSAWRWLSDVEPELRIRMSVEEAIAR